MNILLAPDGTAPRPTRPRSSTVTATTAHAVTRAVAPTATRPLTTWLHEAGRRSRRHPNAADCVRALAPLMAELAIQARDFLQPQHRRGDAAGYTRHLVQATADGSLSLYAMVWLPGQWTPVHDHGSWGVVGVVEGVLEEQTYVRVSADPGADSGLQLVPGGTLLLPAGGVTTFVPAPDHIHITGVPAGRSAVLSLHLYGRTMSEHNVYDVAAGTRRRAPTPPARH